MGRTTVNLNSDVHKRAKHMAIDLDISLQKMMVRALIEFMERHKPSQTVTSRKK